MTAQGPGEAVQNANSYHSYSVGMCLQFVRFPCWEIGGLYGSAIDAWYGAKHKHPGDRNPPKGAPCFYSGGQYGHIVIAKDEGMRSTDAPSSGQVNDEALNWPEVHWGDTYLGWTEDLNGVMLPGLTATPPPPKDDDMTGYLHATSDDFTASGDWQNISWENATGPDKDMVAGPGLLWGGKRVSYSLALLASGGPQLGQVQTRLAQGTGRGKDWKIVSNNLAAAHGGRVLDSRVASFGEDRVMRFQISAPKGADLSRVSLEALVWPV